jgi:predicted nucleotidyltransferase
MESKPNDPLIHMTDTERTCVQSYLDLLAQRFANSLVVVWLFGSFARGDTWGRHWPMNSDIDLLILTEQPIADRDREELLNETYPLYLECGRQISPQFRTVREFQNPTTERELAFTARLEEEGRGVLASSTYNPKADA